MRAQSLIAADLNHFIERRHCGLADCLKRLGCHPTVIALERDDEFTDGRLAYLNQCPRRLSFYASVLQRRTWLWGSGVGDEPISKPILFFITKRVDERRDGCRSEAD